MADAVAVLSGTLRDILFDSPSRAHYHPNVSATISVQGFVPVAAIPNLVLLRVRQANLAVPTSITCRVFDSVGNPVLVTPVNTSADGLTEFKNILFTIQGSSTSTFPSNTIFTVEFDLSGVDLAGLIIFYKPTFPMIAVDGSTTPNCLTTVVIS